MLEDWSGACDLDASSHSPGNEVPILPKWTKPLGGYLKCNVDAAFFKERNQVGIGMCLRDEFGHFLGAKTHWFHPILDVHMGEAAGLYFAING